MTWLVDLTQVGSETKEYDFTWPAERLGCLADGRAEERLEAADEVTGRVTIEPAGRDFIVAGRVRTVLAFTCQRCLQPSRAEAEVEFKVKAVPGPIPEDADHEITADETELVAAEDGQLDLEELIREQLLLDRPMVELCRPDCRGLCPRCGQDLNQGQCDCSPTDIDPRLAPLLKFGTRSGNKGD